MPDIRRWSGSTTALLGAADLYAEVFAEPPYNEDHDHSRATFIDRVERYRATKPHFRLQLAWHENDVVGLALGTGIAAGDWWRDRIVPQLPAAIIDEWFGEETFAVVELATSPAHRRTGIAAALLADLVDGLPQLRCRTEHIQRGGHGSELLSGERLAGAGNGTPSRRFSRTVPVRTAVGAGRAGVA